jgi:succinoglycan biosynthesis transport protein ExoP
MTVTDALKLARRWWWILVVCPVVAALAAYLVSSAMTPIYQAKATLLVQQSQTPGVQNYQDLLASQQQTTTYSKLVTTRPVLTEAAQKLGLSGPDAIAGDIAVSSVNNTQLVTVSVSDPNPERAADIANMVSTVFIEQTKAKQEAITGNSLTEIQTNLDQAKKQVDDTETQIAQLRATPDANNGDKIASLQQQLSQYQATYGSLLQAQQQMAIANSQIGAQISVAEQAVPPTAPISPRIKLNTALGGVLGLMLAAGLVALLGYLDNTVKTSDDVRLLTGAGAIGAVPTANNLSTETILNHPRDAATEGLRALRTNLQFATADKGMRTLAITSNRPGDGKTTLAASLALVVAQGGQRVVLIDADLRKPRLHRQFKGLHNRVGLTNALRGTHESVTDLLQRTDVPNLRVLTSGPLPANPPDTLYSPALHEIIAELKEEADLILFDTPPMAVSDPFIIAGIVDGMLLVAFAGRTRRAEISTALERIGLSGTPVIGVILNRVDLEGEGYYYYYRSYYESGSEPPAPPPPAESNDDNRAPEQHRRLGSRPWRSAQVSKQ